MIPLKQLRSYVAQASQLRQAGQGHYAELLAFLPAWHRALEPNHTPLVDQQPWMTFAAIKFLKRILTKEMRVFEYGTGGSTLFFAHHAGEVASVEHDLAWSRQVLAALDHEENDHVALYLLPPEAEPVDAGCPAYGSKPPAEPHLGAAVTATLGARSRLRALADDWDPSAPELYCSSAACYRGLSFRNYVCRIESWPDGYFDLVSVDGRARPSCLRHAQSKVKRGGWLLLDNAERPHYQRAISELRSAAWTETDLSGPGPYVPFFWQTKAWQKPLSS